MTQHITSNNLSRRYKSLHSIELRCHGTARCVTLSMLRLVALREVITLHYVRAPNNTTCDITLHYITLHDCNYETFWYVWLRYALLCGRAVRCSTVRSNKAQYNKYRGTWYNIVQYNTEQCVPSQYNTTNHNQPQGITLHGMCHCRRCHCTATNRNICCMVLHTVSLRCAAIHLNPK